MSDYVLNRACFADLYTEHDAAQRDLAQLLLALAILDSDAAELPSLRLHSDPWLLPVVRGDGANTISLGELANEFYGTANHDLAAFFDSLARSVPTDSSLDELSIDTILRLTPDGPTTGYEGTYESVLAAGIEAMICAALDFTLIGLLRSRLWRFDEMGFVCETEPYVFDHVAEPSHGQSIRERRLLAQRRNLNTRTLWANRKRVFPDLLFGIDVENQLDRISTKIAPLLLRRLAELDARTRMWRESVDAAFPPGPTEIRLETPRTMERYGQDRVFRGCDGTRRTFEEHMWIDRNHRIHLIRNSEQKSVEVGYIGTHLSTMNYPT